MANFWNSSTKDKIHNGGFLGLLFGLLIASSTISWINSIVTSVIDAIPAEYHFQYIKYVVWGLIGLIVGMALDKW